MHVSASKISSGRYMIARRAVLTAACATALGAALALPLAAQSRGPSEVPVAELMKPVGLPDLAIGPDDAKVTVVEYASMTCGHCATFTNNVWPDFKKKYIDTGKVRYVFREFPLDNLAAAASMLARCAGNDKALPMIEVLFEKQNEWAFGEGNPVPRLFEIAKQAGFTQESFDKCLTDQKLLDDITAGRTRASEVFGVSATPTFYVNGKKLEGGNTMDKFDAAIEPLLEKN
ncbi:disulfide bond formation protein DsbA [Hyphomicrobium sulfonivorans]|nr:disulfide bond formation protein DsbA [Hyphomicrobium sulfonivorans]